jgi:hypothetical protein
MDRVRKLNFLKIFVLLYHRHKILDFTSTVSCYIYLHATHECAVQKASFGLRLDHTAHYVIIRKLLGSICNMRHHTAGSL